MPFSLPLLTLLLLATNLRSPITAIGPLYPTLTQALHTSVANIGLLASIPLFIFALFSPVAVSLSARYGLKQSLSLALIAISMGLCLRVIPFLPMLYLGTLIGAIGIAIANVLLPSWLKQNFAVEQLGSITALYAMTMGVSASLFTAITVPIAHLGNWQLALLSPLPLTVVSWLLWRQLNQPKNSSIAPVHSSHHSLYRRPLAWAITAFMGFNSLTFYVIVNWLPAMLTNVGFSDSQAGLLDGVMQLVSAFVGIVLAVMLRRYSPKWLAVIHSLGQIIAVLGLIYQPQWALLWCILLGYFSGAVFIMALTFMSVYAKDAQESARLSAMAQTLGYLLACIGPSLAGWVYQLNDSWQPVQWGYIGAVILMACCGYLVGIIPHKK